MYIGKPDRSHMLSFFGGYEIGKESKVLHEINQKLEEKYDCPKRAMGWNGQVEMYATKIGLSWESAFTKIMLELIIENRTEDESPKLMNSSK